MTRMSPLPAERQKILNPFFQLFDIELHDFDEAAIMFGMSISRIPPPVLRNRKTGRQEATAEVGIIISGRDGVDTNIVSVAIYPTATRHAGVVRIRADISLTTGWASVFACKAPESSHNFEEAPRKKTGKILPL